MKGLAVTFALCLVLAWGAVAAQEAKSAAEGFCKSITHCGGADQDVSCVCQSGCSNEDGTLLAQCHSNGDCTEDKACVGHRCVDPCAGQCGQNTECDVSHHAHYCRCIEGFTGDPRSGCIKEEPSACQTHQHCELNEACLDNVCLNPCEFANCGYGSACEVIEHEIVCIETPQYSSASVVACESHDGCGPDKLCLHDKCTNPCSFGICGPDSDCMVSDHNVFCLPRSYSAVAVGPAKCETDDNCLSSQKCESNACINPCSKGWCYPNTCTVVKHSVVCKSDCVPQDRIINKCSSDSDCASDNLCHEDLGKCVNPCVDPDECGPEAICSVVDHVTTCIPDIVTNRCKNDEHCPVSMQCDGEKCYDPCKKHVCDKDVPCKVVNHAAVCEEKEVGECTNDSECAEDKACRSDKCVDPCLTSKCDKGAMCEVKNHEAICRKILEPILANCTSSKDCPPDQVCDGMWCIDACSLCKPCGVENTCSVVNNKLTCTPLTPEGQCKTDEDCPENQKCNGLACVDPCSLDKVLCKPHQQCQIEDHKPVCKNRPDQECSSNGDCSSVKTCVNYKCEDPCRNNACGSHYNCVPNNHVASCNPKPDDEVKCSTNSDCASHQVCLRGSCKDPCNEFCHGDATCKVVDHVYNCSKSANIRSGNCSGTLFPKPIAKKTFYVITDFKMNWWGANLWCTGHGKQLATVENAEENKRVLDLIEKTKIKNSMFYIGGTDWSVEQHWMWMPTGLPITKYQYWHSGRPIFNYYYNCLVYYEYSNLGYRWYDQYCTYATPNYFICQDYGSKCPEK